MDDCECNKCEEEEEESEDLAQELADTFKFLQPNVNQQDEDNSASDEKDSVHFKIRDYQRYILHLMKFIQNQLMLF